MPFSPLAPPPESGAPLLVRGAAAARDRDGERGGGGTDGGERLFDLHDLKHPFRNRRNPYRVGGEYNVLQRVDRIYRFSAARLASAQAAGKARRYGPPHLLTPTARMSEAGGAPALRDGRRRPSQRARCDLSPTEPAGVARHGVRAQLARASAGLAGYAAFAWAAAYAIGVRGYQGLGGRLGLAGTFEDPAGMRHAASWPGPALRSASAPRVRPPVGAAASALAVIVPALRLGVRHGARLDRYVTKPLHASESSADSSTGGRPATRRRNSSGTCCSTSRGFSGSASSSPGRAAPSPPHRRVGTGGAAAHRLGQSRRLPTAIACSVVVAQACKAPARPARDRARKGRAPGVGLEPTTLR